MENSINKTLKDFIDSEENEQNETTQNKKKQVLDEREGLIERIDRIFVTKEGKQLLREQY